MQGEGPNWFRGTSSEHSVFYQYNLVSTNNTYMSMIQTESPCKDIKQSIEGKERIKANIL